MPTITATGRATIGGDPSEYRLPRSTVTASTGMNLPRLSEAPQAPSPVPTQPNLGQPDIQQEETSAPSIALSPQLTAIARRQQKLQQEIQTFREERAQWERDKADYIPKSGFKAKAQLNAVEAFKDLGTDYEELTQLLLAQSQGDDPVKALQAEFQKMKATQEENTNKQYDATLKQYKAEAMSLVSKDPKKYFLIDKEQAHDAIVQHIVATWEEDPDQVLSVDEAANDIEAFLREEAKKKKALIEELEGPKEPVQAQPEKKLPPPRSGVRTLTQQVESTPTRTYNQYQHLSMKERIAQSIARAQK